MNYANVAFSDAAKILQARAGSRTNYARMEKSTRTEGLTSNEQEFIEDRDSVYLATLGQNGYPYIQFRGGPPGFIKMIDNKTLAFIDFQGNQQFVSQGNLTNNNKVALIFMDYPAKARLKIYAEAEVLEIADHPELYEKVKLENYAYRPGRLIVLHVKAFDWNCPQHITPRFTLAEVEKAFESQKKYIEQLEKEIEDLNTRANKLT